MCKDLGGFKMLLLLSCWIIAAITAEVPPRRHYRMKNSSLCLQIGKEPPYKGVQWSFHGKAVVFQKNVTPTFKDKVHYSPENHSLCIRKLNEMDAGIYKASIADRDYNMSVETHMLIIQESVPTPIIRMSVMYSNLSAGFCNITVNCSIQDEWLLSVCDENGCRTSQRSFSTVNITIAAVHRSIECSGNNHVSRSNASESLPVMCFNKSNSEQDAASPLLYVIIIPIVTALCLSLFAFFWHLANEHNHNQVLTAPDQIIQDQPQPVPRVSISSSSDAEASYENVDVSQPSQTSNPRGELGSCQSQTVDTVYSCLQAPNASAGNSDGSKHAQGRLKAQEALTSHSVAQDEAAPPPQIDTLYCVLQKPKNQKMSQHHL